MSLYGPTGTQDVQSKYPAAKCIFVVHLHTESTILSPCTLSSKWIIVAKNRQKQDELSLKTTETVTQVDKKDMDVQSSNSLDASLHQELLDIDNKIDKIVTMAKIIEDIVPTTELVKSNNNENSDFLQPNVDDTIQCRPPDESMKSDIEENAECYDVQPMDDTKSNVQTQDSNCSSPLISASGPVDIADIKNSVEGDGAQLVLGTIEADYSDIIPSNDVASPNNLNAVEQRNPGKIEKTTITTTIDDSQTNKTHKRAKMTSPTTQLEALAVRQSRRLRKLTPDTERIKGKSHVVRRSLRKSERSIVLKDFVVEFH